MHILLIIVRSLNYSQLRSENSSLITCQIKFPCVFHKQARITKKYVRRRNIEKQTKQTYFFNTLKIFILWHNTQ